MNRVGLSILVCWSIPAYGLFDMYYAQKEYAAGNLDAAADLYTKIVIDRPDDWRALYNVGTCALVKKRYDDAICHFDKVIELHPDYSAAHERRALAQRLRDEERQNTADSDQSCSQGEDSQKRDDNSQEQDSTRHDAQSSQQKGSEKEQFEESANASDRHDGDSQAHGDTNNTKSQQGEEQQSDAGSAVDAAEEQRLRAEQARAAYDAATESINENATMRERQIIEYIEESDTEAQRRLLLKAYQNQQQGASHVRAQQW